MKCNEFRRWLINQGVEITTGSKHDICRYNGNFSTLPRYGSKEISKGLRHAIVKQLGLRPVP